MHGLVVAHPSHDGGAGEGQGLVVIEKSRLLDARVSDGGGAILFGDGNVVVADVADGGGGAWQGDVTKETLKGFDALWFTRGGDVLERAHVV
jgi:hypothetical protein